MVRHKMSTDNIVALLVGSIPVLSAIGYGIWLLSRIKVQVEGISKDLTSIALTSKDHIHECDEDRVKLNFLIESHSKAIKEIRDLVQK